MVINMKDDNVEVNFLIWDEKSYRIVPIALFAFFILQNFLIN